MNISVYRQSPLAISIEERRKRDRERKRLARLNPEVRERNRATDRKYRKSLKNNPDRVLADRVYHTNYMTTWRKNNPQKNLDMSRRSTGTEKRIEYQRMYFQANKERLKEQRRKYYLDNRDYFLQKSNEWYVRNKENRAILMQTKRRVVLEHYGGICTCCGESTTQFLAIHHSNNDGYLERKTRKINVFDYLISNNFPEGFEILCHNCNLASAFYGVCPHREC